MIRLDVSKCSGCRRCEVACSFFHEERVSRRISRIKVVKIEDKWIDVSVVCQQCQERYCIKCPESAITIGEMGEILVDLERCTGCGACERQCPIGAIEMVDDKPLVCDLCGGDPQCVRECSLGAITFEPRVMEAVSLKDMREKTRGLTPEARRVHFALTTSHDMREGWLNRRADPCSTGMADRF